MDTLIKTGYAASEYPHALAAFGTPRHLVQAGAWLLQVPVPDSDYQDARGPYPLFTCQNWSALVDELVALKDEIVSVILVVDPFSAVQSDVLAHIFPDVCYAYKDHFIIDLSRPADEIISPRHMRNVKKAQALVQVEHCDNPYLHLGTWCELYANLVQRHAITGIAAFSPESFRAQFNVPGLDVFRAHIDGETVGMVLWVQQNGVGYYHLAAYSDRGYETRSSFALFYSAIQYFSGKLNWLNLGAGAGIQGDSSDGLTQFKRGWSTGTRPAYLCGRILNPTAYQHLVKTSGVSESSFFPLYRKPG